MRPFQLHQAENLEDALQLLQRFADDDTHAMAGGTSLVLLMNLGLVEPARIISLRGLAELQGVQQTHDGGLHIGALSTHRQLEVSPQVAAFCPALAQTFGHVATIRIRNQATLGGNLAHADPAQDPPPMLIALDARVELQSASGKRTLPLEELFVDYLTTKLDPGELITTIHVPPLPQGTRATYKKFLPRTQDDYATVSVAATLRLEPDGRCAHATVALGSVAGVPVRAHSVEAALRGEQLTDQRIADAAALVTDLVDPPDDARGSPAYKRRMARVWTERALRELRDRTNGSVASHS
jgi:carbon-monoxide dehydrogenase medium subunit